MTGASCYKKVEDNNDVMGLFGKENEIRQGSIFTIALYRNKDNDEEFYLSEYNLDFDNPQEIAEICIHLEKEMLMLKRALEIHEATDILEELKREQQDVLEEMKQDLQEADTISDLVGQPVE